MSNLLITKAFEFDTGSSVTKLVLIKLCDNASDEGFCWPSHDTIARHCSLSKKSVINHIKKLEDIGIITKSNRFQNNRQRANMYEISFRGESQDLGVNPRELRGESQGVEGCTTFTQNPKENPKEEPTKKKYIKKNFTPPTIEDIASYCLERNNGIDSVNFHDFYSAKGWMIGKNKMKDWKAAVRTWERNNKSNNHQAPKGNPWK